MTEKERDLVNKDENTLKKKKRIILEIKLDVIRRLKKQQQIEYRKRSV